MATDFIVKIGKNRQSTGADLQYNGSVTGRLKHSNLRELPGCRLIKESTDTETVALQSNRRT
jgi:hypothetical protein